MVSDIRVETFRAVEERVVDRLLPRSTEHHVRWSGGSLRVVEAGSGHPVVFLHGITGTLTNFAGLAACLAADHRCVLVDLPGHGLSGPLDLGRRAPREVLVAAVASVVEKLADGSPVVLVGNSLGGMAALYLAADRPHLVSSVAVLGEPAYAFPGARARFPLNLIGRRRLGPRILGGSPPPLRLYARMVRRAYGRQALEAIGRDELDLDRMSVWAGRNASSVASLMRALMGPRGLAREDVALRDADYEQIEVPVWFLWGTDDPFLSPAGGRPWVNRVSGATIDVVRGGHVPWFDSPDLACQRIASLAGSGLR